MFTGIIEEVGKIDRISRGSASARLRVSCKNVTEGTKVGDSIAVNGVCLTATRVDKDGFEADVMDETVSRTSLASLKSGSPVNLERAMSADGRFGGHIVAGHVDCTGTIKSIENKEMAVVYEIQPNAGAHDGTDKSTGNAMRNAGADAMRYIVEKGSIAIDGISLTVASVSKETFTVSIIPHTISNTTLSGKKTGDIVNLETDIIGKYVEKLMGSGMNPAIIGTAEKESTPGALSGDYDKAKEFLIQNGF